MCFMQFGLTGKAVAPSFFYNVGKAVVGWAGDRDSLTFETYEQKKLDVDDNSSGSTF